MWCSNVSARRVSTVPSEKGVAMYDNNLQVYVAIPKSFFKGNFLIIIGILPGLKYRKQHMNRRI